MALAYLIDPEIQFSDKSGMLNVAGFLRVYLNGTDDRAVTYKDFNGTLNEADIILDNNGRAVVVADSSKAYRLEVYNREGALLWTTYPLETLKGGGGGTAGFNVVSSDGTVEVNRYSEGGVTNFDLSVNYDFDQSNVLVAASGALASDGDFQFTYDPITSDGERIYLEYGQIRAKSGWYHFDASVEITWSGTPANREAPVVVTGPYEAERVMFDLSYAHKECLTIAGDVDIGTDDTPITFAIQGMPTGMTATVVNASVHALVAGSAGGGTGPSYQPGTGITIEGDTISVDQSTVAMKSDLPDMSGYQEKLTTGDGISIDQNNEISVKTDGATITVNAAGELVATGGSFTQVQADYAQTNNQAVDYIKNKPDLSVFARSADLATVATTGDYNDLINKPTIPTKTSDLTNDSGFITDADAPVKDVQVGGVSVVNAQGVAEISIPATGVLDVEVDGASVVNAQGVAEITMPDLSGYATTQALTTGLAGKQDVISDLATIRSGAADGATAVQPGDLATVATSGAYSDLTGTPTIPTATSDLTNDSGFITLSDVPAQVNADWAESDSTDPSYIQNKPQNLVQDAAYVHTDNNFTTTLKDKLDGIEAGAEVNVQADWNQSNSASDDYIKNKPTIRNVPAVTSNDNGKVLKATYSDLRIGYGWEAESSDVPAYTTSDDGKVLGVVDNSGTASLQWVTPAAGTVTDVEVDGTSVVNAQGIAEITIPAQVQSDWTENDSADPAYIQHRPSEQTLIAGSGISITESNSAVTIASTTESVPAVTSGDDGKVLTASYSGGAGSFAWESIPATREVPAVTSSDDAKVLTATYSGGAGSFAWASLPAAPTLASLNTAGITDLQVVQSLPASTTATVLYLIPET